MERAWEVKFPLKESPKEGGTPPSKRVKILNHYD